MELNGLSGDWLNGGVDSADFYNGETTMQYPKLEELAKTLAPLVDELHRIIGKHHMDRATAEFPYEIETEDEE